VAWCKDAVFGWDFGGLGVVNVGETETPCLLRTRRLIDKGLFQVGNFMLLKVLPIKMSTEIIAYELVIKTYQ
jgi:hypothetical protein